ncbi:MAG: hypothetical protein LAT76_12525, partial [Schleiferiaceae bacterium]|nr:hypothetical protein [Schleiferiaceae bacterium]
MQNVQKALAAFGQKNLPMVKIYVGNILKEDPQNPHGLYLEGEYEIRRGNLSKTTVSWQKCLEICPEYRAELYFFLGVILYETGQEEAGKDYLRQFLTNPDRDKGFDKDAKAILKESEVLQELLDNPVAYQPEPVLAISTPRDEYLAIISPDNAYCFFTRKEKVFDKYDGPGAAEQIVEQFTVASHLGNGLYDEGNPMPEPFNTTFNQGGASVTANNNELFLTICATGKDGYNNCDIYYSKREYGNWSTPINLGKHINNPDTWESQASISADGQTLYFASDRPGGKGGTDIYKCSRNTDGSWSSPENLGGTINTDKDEKSPFIHSDSQTLYFSSNGHPGVGGFDIFLSKNRDGKWETPRNIGYPINSEKDEVGLFVSLDGQKGYFNSNKLKKIGVGGWDLFSFEMPDNVRPEDVTLIKGSLASNGDVPTEDVKLTVKNLKTNTEKSINIEAGSGNYAQVVRKDEQADVILKVEKDGAAFNSKFIDANENGEQGVVTADFDVSPMEIGKEYRLNDINFATNSFELDRKAKFIVDEFIA